MKLESVEAFPVKIRAEESLRGGTFGYTHYQTVLVRVVLEGVEGWGEAMTRSDPQATALLVRQMASGMVGREHPSVMSAWEGSWKELRVRGHTRGVDVEALSGIEIALYDAYGKLQRKPLSALFSRSPASEVPAFAGSLFSSRGPLAEQVELARENELVGAKVKVGFGVEEDARTLGSVRKMWPDGMLVADANGAYDVATATRACAAFSQLDLAWFEEPVLSDDLEGYTLLRGSEVKIGAGETWFAGDFREPIEKGLISVLEPSVSRCGGVGVEVSMALLAREHGISFSPMTGMNSVVSLAASIQAAAAVGTVGVEYNPFANPIQRELATGLEAPRGGRVKVPTAPGLGIEVDLRFVKANPG